MQVRASTRLRTDVPDLGTFLTSLSLSEECPAPLPPEVVLQIVEQLGAPAFGSTEQIAFTFGTDVRDDLSLVVAASGDRFVAPEHSVELADGIPGARPATVTGGHAPVFEDLGQTLKVRSAFLEKPA
ncbi:alpha/beta fold hydrolase [Streptomyces sp. NPDC056930]|uniref:alpha/beta fold hydrolase n=1 Tax=Streptomyces sp. NPDC056930 TaxID=3345967 RepID=UPI003645440D